MSNKQSTKIDRSDLLAILAVLISLATLFVSLRETSIMKDQQEIMRSQQKATVWPYVKHHQGFTFSAEHGSGLILKLTNKGVGPAKIDSGYWLVNDQAIRDYADMAKLIQANGQSMESMSNLSFRPINNIVLSPQEEITILELSFPDESIQRNSKDWIFQPRICYCSIYDDCWRVGNLSQKNGTKGCQ